VEAAIATDPNSSSIQADAGGALMQMHKISEAQQAFASALRGSAGLPNAESQVIAPRIAQMQQPQR
jgi:hypothetical protein